MSEASSHEDAEAAKPDLGGDQVMAEDAESPQDIVKADISMSEAEARDDDSVQKPCAMVPPNGPCLARSGSTWIHW